MEILDISLSINKKMQYYPGEIIFDVNPIFQLSKGDGGNSSQLTISSHAGTHIDAPKHVIENGETVDKIDLDKLMGDSQLIDLSQVTNITIDKMKSLSLDLNGKIVILKLLQDGTLREGALNPSKLKSIPEQVSEWFVEKKVKAVAIDALAYGSTRSHRILLEKDIPIIEGLDLNGVSEGRYRFICLPLKLDNLDGSPARAILMKEN